VKPYQNPFALPMKHTYLSGNPSNHSQVFNKEN
jgi:hypothetical protein